MRDFYISITKYASSYVSLTSVNGSMMPVCR